MSEKEPVPWETVEKTHSEIPEDVQEKMIADWKRSGQNGPDIGIIARRYQQEWTQVWRLLRLVHPARERKERGIRARAKRMAQREAAEKK